MLLNSKDIIGGHYKIERLLGNGGFGKTYLAEEMHLPDKPSCVVKEIQPCSNDPAVLQDVEERFNREANALYRLGKHDQIPQLFGYFEDRGKFYLVQEYIEGHDLSQELKVGTQLREDQVIDLLKDILEVLKVVHEQNIIHRDIKPSNLIRRDQDRKIVLIDFGAVKEINTLVVNASGQVETTKVIGTKGYMPPEQYLSKPQLSSDIYAVGMIGIEALTGLKPSCQIQTDENREILWRPWGSHVSQGLADILDKMVRQDCKVRYQSAAEVLDALQGLAGQKRMPPIRASSTIQVSQSSVAHKFTSQAHKSSTWKLLCQAAIMGSGSWLLALVLFSLISTVWLGTTFWLLILANLIFGVFAKKLSLFEKFRFLVIAVISTVLTSIIFPQNLKAWNLIEAFPKVILVILLLTIVAGLLSLILLVISQLLTKRGL
jgi:serine/threonine protein kinase